MDTAGAVIPVCFYHFDESIASRLGEKDTLRLLHPTVKRVWVPAGVETAVGREGVAGGGLLPAAAAAGSAEPPAGSSGASFCVVLVDSAADVAVLGRAAGQRLQAGHAQLSIATFDG